MKTASSKPNWLRIEFLFIVMMFGLCASVNAQETTQGALMTLAESVFKPLDAFQGRLVDSGKILISAMVVCHIAAGGLMFAAGTTDIFDLAFKGLKLTFVASLAMAAIIPSPWLGALTGLGGSVSLPQAISAGFYKLASIAAASSTGGWTELSAASNGSANGTHLFGVVAGKMMENLVKLIDMPWYATSGETSWLETFTQAINPVVWLNILYWFGTVMMYLLACGALLLELIGSELTIRFATAFTPLLVPWILFKPLEFLFNGWLRALLIGSVGFVVGILMLSGFGEFITASSALIASSMNNDTLIRSSGALMIYLPTFLGCFLFFMLSPRANQIASAMISGSGVGGLGMRDLFMAGMAAKATAAAPGQLAGHASNLGRNVKGAMQSTAGALGAAKKAITSGGASTRIGQALSAGRTAGSTAMRNSGGSARAGGQAFAQAFSSNMSGSYKAPASVRNSPGGQATTNMAAAQGKSLTERQYKETAHHANAAYSHARANGAPPHDAKASANAAAQEYLSGVSKPRSPNQPGRTPSMSPTSPAFPSA